MEVAQLSSDVASLLADARSGKGLTLSQLQALQQIHQLKAWQQREAEERGEKAANLRREAEPVPFQRHLLVSDVSRQSVSQAQSGQKANTVATQWSPLQDCSRDHIPAQTLDEVPSLTKPTEQLQDPQFRAYNAVGSHHNTRHGAQNTVEFSGAVVVAEDVSSAYSDSCESLMSADSLRNDQPRAAAGGEATLGVGGLGNPLLRGNERPIHPGVGVGSGCGTFEEMLEKQLQLHHAKVSMQNDICCPVDACPLHIIH